jgi:hypothetical protein
MNTFEKGRMHSRNIKIQKGISSESEALSCVRFVAEENTEKKERYIAKQVGWKSIPGQPIPPLKQEQGQSN